MEPMEFVYVFSFFFLHFFLAFFFFCICLEYIECLGHCKFLSQNYIEVRARFESAIIIIKKYATFCVE